MRGSAYNVTYAYDIKFVDDTLKAINQAISKVSGFVGNQMVSVSAVVCCDSKT